MSLIANMLDDLIGVTETPFDVKRRLRSAITLYGSTDSEQERLAAGAIVGDRAVFWKTFGYGSTRMTLAFEAILQGEAIETAVRREFAGHPYEGRRVDFLDRLVPLNRQATADLLAAYEAFGEFRRAEEVERRRVRDCRPVSLQVAS